MKRTLYALALTAAALYAVVQLSATPSRDLPCCNDCPVWCPLCKKC